MVFTGGHRLDPHSRRFCHIAVSGDSSLHDNHRGPHIRSHPCRDHRMRRSERRYQNQQLGKNPIFINALTSLYY